MRGSLYRINVGSGGIPKNSVEEAKVTTDRIERDDWHNKKHGGPQRAICLYSQECLTRLEQVGFDELYPGALGENFTTRGLEYRDVRIGNKFLVGDDVVIQISMIRTPCQTIEAVYPGISEKMINEHVAKGDHHDSKWGMTGFYARVLREGTIRRNDLIKKIDT